ncbi:MAG: 6,7-dimethyl-8-ribityllumazine synthase [Deltaproteobacteria bacterium]|nr:MAG: 6,7-dimethyl-8-ribityllumazine synthase [Pseudomonadota bacterium]PIE66322.1 MAG: 6,7-dimethyl-8-ribityllumazine synthase [Deltaproteobacteria bacterium]
MPNVIEGHLSAAGLKLAVVVSRFNSIITDRLVEGALDAIARTGGDTDEVTIYRTPGGYEIPAAVKRVAQAGGVDAIIALGAVIRGATPHFEYIAAEVTKGLAAVQLEVGIPIAYGVITPDTLEQAIERAGSKAGNKGFEAAMAAIEMANLFAQIEPAG